MIKNIKRSSKLHIQRNNCRLCGSVELRKILDLKDIPVGEKYSESPFDEEGMRFPMNIYQCYNCKAVQTIDDIESDYLWGNYTYFSEQSKVTTDHFQVFADNVIQKYNFNENSKVFDIGSNDGSLLNCFVKRKIKNVFGIDPSIHAVQKAKIKNIPTYNGLFTSNVITNFPEKYNKVDLVTAFNVFAHSPDMDQMMQGVKNILTENGIFCFEIQYLIDILDKNLLGTFFHEHMIHYSLNSIVNFLNIYNFKVIDVERNDIQQGSMIIYSCHKKLDIKQKQKVLDTIEIEKKGGYLSLSSFGNLKNNIIKSRLYFKKLKERLDKSSVVAGYGAARSGPTLAIQYDITKIISYIFDDHPSKCNKFSAFENIKILPTLDIKSLKPDYIIILAWIYTKQIVNNNLDYIQNGGTFITLWPEVMEVNNANIHEFLN